jgi:hypothetical protein
LYIPPAAVRRHQNGSPALGTGLSNLDPEAELSAHGWELRTLFRTLLDLRVRNSELLEQLVLATTVGDENEDFSYSPIPPSRSFYVDVVFERGTKIPPMPIEIPED